MKQNEIYRLCMIVKVISRRKNIECVFKAKQQHNTNNNNNNNKKV